jgi:hypothetical protein
MDKENYHSVKKNDIMSHAGKWMELEIIMLRKLSHAEKDKHHMFFSYSLKMNVRNIAGTDRGVYQLEGGG